MTGAGQHILFQHQIALAQLLLLMRIAQGVQHRILVPHTGNSIGQQAPALPMIPLLHGFKGHRGLEIAKGRKLPGIAAAAAQEIALGGKFAHFFTGRTLEQHRGKTLCQTALAVSHGLVLLALMGIFIDIPFDEGLYLFFGHCLQLFRAVSTHDAAVHFAPANALAPTGCGEIRALQAVSQQPAATHFRHSAGGRHHGAGFSVPSGLTLGKKTHILAFLQLPQDGHGGITAADTLAPGNGLTSILNDLGQQTHPEQMLAGHEMKPPSREAQGHQNGVKIGHMIADDQGGHFFLIPVAAEGKEPLGRLAHQMPQEAVQPLTSVFLHTKILAFLYPIYSRWVGLSKMARTTLAQQFLKA